MLLQRLSWVPPVMDVRTRAYPGRHSIHQTILISDRVPPRGRLRAVPGIESAGAGHAVGMHLPEPRGALSAALTDDLTSQAAVSARTLGEAERTRASGALTDDDLQLSLAVCYELHYRGFDGVDDRWEWDPALIGLRSRLEECHLAALRS